ncbi:hypothetical protein ACFZB9_14070 [Kitasatospora sp. NPDC008050]|uniref:hypothetical protein n=1 Tax=Kitasatospora sp. NPDC008050 TaxID=3364021 RepID=UPI0036EE7272
MIDHPPQAGRPRDTAPPRGSWWDLAESITCDAIALVAVAWLGNLLLHLVLPAWPALTVLLWLGHLGGSWPP